MSANTELFLRGADTLTRGDDAIVPKLVSFELFELDFFDPWDLDDETLLALGKIRIRGRGSGVERPICRRRSSPRFALGG